MKPTKQQLGSMSRRLIQAKNEGDFRYTEFITRMMLKTGQTVTYIERQIRIYAEQY